MKKRVFIIFLCVVSVLLTISCTITDKPESGAGNKLEGNTAGKPESNTDNVLVSNTVDEPKSNIENVPKGSAVTIPENNVVDVPESNQSDIKGDEFLMNLKKLVEGNKNCALEIFVLGFLPSDNYDSNSGNDLVQVHSDDFPTFADLEQYVRSIYCDNEASRLMYGKDGNALYLDIDGVLYTDMRLQGGMGYYVNLDDYEIVIREQQAETCDFDLITTEEFGGEVSEVILSFQAVLEDDVWKLKKMVY